jgi:hypothetical protein
MNNREFRRYLTEKRLERLRKEAQEANAEAACLPVWLAPRTMPSSECGAWTRARPRRACICSPPRITA